MLIRLRLSDVKIVVPRAFHSATPGIVLRLAGRELKWTQQRRASETIGAS